MPDKEEFNQLAIGILNGCLNRDQALDLINSLDVHNVKDVITLHSLANCTSPYEFCEDDFDNVVGRINPHEVLGSYALVLLYHAGKISDNAAKGIKSKIQLESIDIYQKESDYGTVLGNLLEVHFIELNVPQIDRKPFVLARELTLERLN